MVDGHGQPRSDGKHAQCPPINSSLTCCVQYMSCPHLGEPGRYMCSRPGTENTPCKTSSPSVIIGQEQRIQRVTSNENTQLDVVRGTKQGGGVGQGRQQPLIGLAQGCPTALFVAIRPPPLPSASLAVFFLFLRSLCSLLLSLPPSSRSICLSRRLLDSHQAALTSASSGSFWLFHTRLVCPFPTRSAGGLTVVLSSLVLSFSHIYLYIPVSSRHPTYIIAAPAAAAVLPYCSLFCSCLFFKARIFPFRTLSACCVDHDSLLNNTPSIPSGVLLVIKRPVLEVYTEVHRTFPLDLLYPGIPTCLPFLDSLSRTWLAWFRQLTIFEECALALINKINIKVKKKGCCVCTYTWIIIIILVSISACCVRVSVRLPGTTPFQDKDLCLPQQR